MKKRGLFELVLGISLALCSCSAFAENGKDGPPVAEKWNGKADFQFEKSVNLQLPITIFNASIDDGLIGYEGQEPLCRYFMSVVNVGAASVSKTIVADGMHPWDHGLRGGEYSFKVPIFGITIFEVRKQTVSTCKGYRQEIDRYWYKEFSC